MSGASTIEWTGLRARALGAFKTAARRVGLSLEEYRARMDAGERWCTACKSWHPLAAFDTDASRGNGIKATCKNIARVRGRLGRPERSRNEKEKSRARAVVARDIRYGRLPRANAVPCHDCGHVWADGDLRHEYDHHLGYAPQHRLDVQAVCTPCHRTRERARAQS